MVLEVENTVVAVGEIWASQNGPLRAKKIGEKTKTDDETQLSITYNPT